MEKEFKKEARKQYFHYFRVWFILLGIFAILGLGAVVKHALEPKETGRGNDQEPMERVYDYADVLTDEEEQNLQDYITGMEDIYHIDLVLVTINEEIESQGDWEDVMRNTADDFYDQNLFGYNKVHGDGALLLDNWYEGQKGSWLSTCGVVEYEFSSDDINTVLRDVYDVVDDSPYEAYKAYVDRTCMLLQLRQQDEEMPMPWAMIIVVPLVVAGIYAIVNLSKKRGDKTVTPTTYMEQNNTVIKGKRDQYIRKSVITRRIETQSSSHSSGGSSHSSGGGGHHVSSGGVSHGGGGMRR